MKKTLIFLFLLCGPLVVQAKDVNYFDLTLEELMNIKVTTASKNEEKSFESASATYVITNEDIRRSGATSIPEALRLAPGVQVARIDSDEWAVAIRGFNDRFSDKLLVIVDGRSAYVPLFSGVYWNTLDYVLEDIDRIEVVRGPGGALWGANAVNGIINIITKSAKDVQGGYISASRGNFDKYIAEVRYGGETRSGDYYSIFAKSTEKNDVIRLSDGEDSKDDWNMNRVGFKYEKDFSGSDDSFSVQGEIYDGIGDQIYVFPSSSDEVLYETHTFGGNLVSKYHKEFSSDSKVDAQFYYDYDNRNIIWSDQSTRTFDVDVQHFYRYNDSNELLYGGEYRNIHDKLRTQSPPGGTVMTFDPEGMTYDIYSLFFQNKTEFVEDKFFTTIGSKFDYNDFTHFTVQPTLRISYFPKDNHHLWAAVSRTVRTPTRWEDGMSRINEGNSAIIRGNKSFDNESIVTYEAGYKSQPGANFAYDITGFYNELDRVRNIITDGSTCNVGPYSATCVDIDNSANAESYGGEISFTYDPTKKLRLSAAYSFLRIHMDNRATTSLGSEKLIEDRYPFNQVSARAYYNITEKLQFDNFLYFVDNLRHESREDNSPSYIRYDSRLGYELSDRAIISLIGQNLTDHYHQEFGKSLYSKTTEIGRSVLIEFEYHF